jgi:hypothetical protein
MSPRPSHLSRLLSKIRDIPPEFAERFLELNERQDFFLFRVRNRLEGSIAGRLWLKARWVLMSLLWLGGLGLGYTGLARVSNEQGLGWPPSELALRTLQLFFRDSGSLRSGVANDQTYLMLELARVLLIFALLFTGILVVPRLIERYM